MCLLAIFIILGEPAKALEKIYSMFGHICGEGIVILLSLNICIGVHDFPLHDHVKKCSHEILEQDRDKPYFTQG